MPDIYRPSYPDSQPSYSDKRRRSSPSPSDGNSRKMPRMDEPPSRPGIPSLREFTSRNTADKRYPSKSSSRRSSVSKGNGCDISDSSRSRIISPNNSDLATERITPASVATGIKETVDELVGTLLEASTASELNNLALQRAAAAHKEYEMTKKSFAAFPPLAEQKRNRKALADKEVASTKSTVHDLRSSLSQILKGFLTSLGDGAPANGISAEFVSRESHNKVLTELEKAKLDIRDARNKATEAKRIADEIHLKHEEATKIAIESRRQADEAISKTVSFETQMHRMQDSILSFQRFQKDTTQTLDTLKVETTSVTDNIRRNSDLIGNVQHENQAHKVKVDKHATHIEELLSKDKKRVAMLEEERIKIRALEENRVSKKEAEANVQELKGRIEAIDAKVVNNSERASQEIIQQSKALEALKSIIFKDLESSAMPKTDVAMSSEIGNIKASLQRLRQEIFGVGEGHDLEGQGLAIALRSSLTRLFVVEADVTAIQTSLTEVETNLREEIAKLDEVAKSKDEILDELLEGLNDKLETNRSTLADSFEWLQEEVRLAVVNMGKATPTLPSIEVIKRDLDNKIEGSAQRLVAFQNTVTDLRKADVQRLDVLTHAAQELERRFNNIQTDELYSMIIHQMQIAFPTHIPQLQHVMDKIKNLALHVDQQTGSSNGHIKAVEARLSTVAATQGGKLETLGEKLDSFSARRTPTAGETEIASIKNELLELHTTLIPQIEALDTRVNKFPGEQLNADLCTLAESLESLQGRVVSQHDGLRKRIERIQGWLDTILRQSYGGDSGDLPDWEQSV